MKILLPVDGSIASINAQTMAPLWIIVSGFIAAENEIEHTIVIILPF